MRRFSRIVFSLLMASCLPLSAYGQTKATSDSSKTVAASSPKPDSDKIYQDEYLKCNLECCDFNKPATIQVEAPVYQEPVYFKGAKPSTLKQVGTLKAGQKVKVVQGILFSKPLPFVSKANQKIEVIAGEKRQAQSFKKGQTVYVLGALNYGFQRVWVDGKIVEMESVDFFDTDSKFTTTVSKKESYQDLEQVWFQVKNEKNNTGWVIDEADSVVVPAAGCQ